MGSEVSDRRTTAQRYLDTVNFNYDPAHDLTLAEKVLSQLPDTSQEIADFLELQSLKANCGHAQKCAIAEYLTQTVPLPKGFAWSVSSSDTTVNFHLEEHERATISASPSEQEEIMAKSQRWFSEYRGRKATDHEAPVWNFIEDFDRHKYPRLEK